MLPSFCRCRSEVSLDISAVTQSCNGNSVGDGRSASRDDALYRLAQLEVWPKAADGHGEATGRDGLLILVWVGTCWPDKGKGVS